MNNLSMLLSLFLLGVPASAQAPQPAQANPMSTWLRNAYTGNRNNIVRSAERMSEEFYAMRPGAQQEVRTFGQQVAHVATYNSFGVRRPKGKRTPIQATSIS